MANQLRTAAENALNELSALLHTIRANRLSVAVRDAKAAADALRAALAAPAAHIFYTIILVSTTDGLICPCICYGPSGKEPALFKDKTSAEKLIAEWNITFPDAVYRVAKIEYI